ncbi:DoxX family protein [Luteolibacter flavescens]|uniref:DoxX family protein n=1 Tax=Luteolibacter flavescens TaxID=1859460 RepID=A0ABT3FKZ3_9BACT|nr:DoxX family protein [Luteolibacter flavescens]MCW1884235.1 DoxX family protein [Luteolibacter flavescens]
MKKFFFDCGTRDPLASSGLLLMRIGFGWMMLYGHGIAKIQNFEKLKATWAVPGVFPLNFMSSPVSLMATICAEVGAASLLILGLMTRPAAFVLGFAMCVAAFQVLAHSPMYLPAPGAKEPAVMYLFFCFTLIITGAGKWSVDAGFDTDKRRRRWR